MVARPCEPTQSQRVSRRCQPCQSQCWRVSNPAKPHSDGADIPKLAPRARPPSPNDPGVPLDSPTSVSTRPKRWGLSTRRLQCIRTNHSCCCCCWNRGQQWPLLPHSCRSKTPSSIAECDAPMFHAIGPALERTQPDCFGHRCPMRPRRLPPPNQPRRRGVEQCVDGHGLLETTLR